MKILGFDTSTDVITMSIIEDETVVGELNIKGNGGPVEKLTWELQRFLCNVRIPLQDIDGIAVGRGPGSWTGTRVGIVTAKVLAFTINKPLVGVSSFDALMEGSGLRQGKIFVINDFGAKRVFLGNYEVSNGAYKRIEDYQIVEVMELDSHAYSGGTIIGKGTVKHWDTLARFKDISVLPRMVFPQSRHIALIGLRALTSGSVDDCYTLTPIYVSLPKAQLMTHSETLPLQ